MTALVMLSACETIEPQQGIVSGAVVEETVANDIITATIGADTKTYLEWDWVSEVYKTRWSADDYIWLIEDRSDSLKYQTCNLLEGAGTSSAKFAANLKADSYYAVYSSNAYFNGGVLSVELYDNQYHWSYGDSEHKDFLNHAYPMMAKSSTTSFEFENLCSVLKVSVTGHGERLDVISVKSNDESEVLSGIGTVYFDGDAPRMEMDQSGYTYVNYSVECVLDETPLDCYIVLPSQTYETGFTIELHTDEGIMDLTTGQNIVLEQSKLHEVPVIAYETEYFNEYWQMEVTEDNGESWNAYQMEYEDGMFVMKDWYFNDGVEFRFFETLTEVWYGCPGTFRRGAGKTNTRVDLASGEGWWWFQIYDPGYYDIYIDPLARCAYIMSDGFTPDDIPTRENVLYEDYANLYNYAVEGQYIKMYGTVLAKCGYGFILAIDGYRSNSVYVYDRNGLCDVELGNWIDIYAKLAYYRYLPELVVNEGEYWMHVLDDTYNDYEPETPYFITDPSSFASSDYIYIKYVGTLNISGSYHNIIFEGNTQFKGSITAPLQDLTQFDGERVVVEGYYAGSNTSGDVTYINTIMKRIYPMEENGSSTEDIIPGESFPVTRPRAGFGGQTSVMGSPSPVMRELSYQFYPER